MATLNTSLGWVAGDAERILLVLDLGVSRYTVDQMTFDCNELGSISSSLVARVRALLDEYDDAISIQKGLGVSEDSGKTLIKADVLEWEVNKGGRFEAVLLERGRISDELIKIFAFSTLISPMGVRSNTTSLVRS